MLLGNPISDRWNPMLYKELLQSLRRTSFAIPFMITQVVALITLSLEINQTGNTPYLWIAIFMICAVLIPMNGLTLMREELEDGNHELLQLTRLSRWKISLAKFSGLWSACTLNFIAILPYIIVRYFWGKVELGQELMLCLLLLGGSAVHCSIAIAASCYRSNAKRMMMYLLLLFSALISISIMTGAASSSGPWLWPTINVLIGYASYWFFGICLTRARLRISLMNYEIHPDRLIIILLALAPFATGICAMMTAGYAGFIPVAAFTYLCVADDLVEDEKPSPAAPPVKSGADLRTSSAQVDRQIGE
jgi:ABC-type transport system involved in cytochrome c biogenesis permease component